MSSKLLDINYPNLADALYASNSPAEATRIYIDMLRKTGNVYHAQYAAKLVQIHNMISAPNIKQLENTFISYKDHMRLWSRNTGIQVTFYKRLKSYLSSHEKIRLYFATNKSLSKMHDFLGFRIVLQTPVEDSEQTIKQCYDALNETIRFFTLNQSCLVLEAEPRTGSTISTSKVQELGIFVPKSHYVLPGSEINVKDYVLHPKDRGYQSLHVLFSHPSGLIFEIQVRTTAMDIIAEHGSAKHEHHKSQKYERVGLGEIDFSKISMPGFMLLSTGELYDTIGLLKSIDPFSLLY